MTKITTINYTDESRQISLDCDMRNQNDVFPEIEFVRRNDGLVVTVFWQPRADETEAYLCQIVSHILEQVDETAAFTHELANDLFQQFNDYTKPHALMSFHTQADQIHLHDDRQHTFRDFDTRYPHFHLLFKVPTEQHLDYKAKTLALLNYIDSQLKTPNIRNLFFACGFKQVIKHPIDTRDEESLIQSLTDPEAQQLARAAFLPGFQAFSQKSLLSQSQAVPTQELVATTGLFKRRVQSSKDQEGKQHKQIAKPQADNGCTRYSVFIACSAVIAVLYLISQLLAQSSISLTYDSTHSLQP